MSYSNQNAFTKSNTTNDILKTPSPERVWRPPPERDVLDLKMKFGKHKDKPFRVIPLDYLEWLYRQDWYKSKDFLGKVISRKYEEAVKGR